MSVRISPSRFEEAVSEALGRIPDALTEYLDNVLIVALDEPSAEILRDLGVPEGETLLGVYIGMPLDERSVFDVPLGPDRIEVYRLPLMDMCDSLAELLEEIEITVVHEIAHHFGFEEDALADLGYE